MKRSLLAAASLAAAFALAGASESAAQQTPAPAATSSAPAAQPTPAVDQAAVSALERMSTYLRSLQSFEIHANTTLDEVAADNGQKLTFTGTTTYRIRRPNAFYVETKTDRRERQFYYDGRTVTVVSPRMNYYAQADAPGTIGEVVAELEERYDVQLPLSDLFYWGTSRADPSQFTAASLVGFARVNDADCDQYAFRQGDVDWQIWIQRGEQPLPRKLVITTRSDEARPDYSADLTWTLNPRFDNATFTYRPSSDARRIQIASNEE